MPRIAYAPEADRDLVEIIERIACENLTAAICWLDELEHVFHLLSTQPLMGERFRRRRKTGEVRRHTFGNYVIYYRLLTDGVEIYRVLHGARDHERLV